MYWGEFEAVPSEDWMDELCWPPLLQSSSWIWTMVSRLLGSVCQQDCNNPTNSGGVSGEMGGRFPAATSSPTSNKFAMWTKGTVRWITSYKNIPYIYTSDALEYWDEKMDSGAIHRIGPTLFKVFWVELLVERSRDIPKSAKYSWKGEASKKFRAAMSRWTTFSECKYSRADEDWRRME